MNWYNHLYVGKKAGKRRYSMIQKIRNNEIDPMIHVITPAISGNNILDIYPMSGWLLYHHSHPDAIIIGIADGYWEALNVVKTIIDDLYHETGGFKLKDWL